MPRRRCVYRLIECFVLWSSGGASSATQERNQRRRWAVCRRRTQGKSLISITSPPVPFLSRRLTRPLLPRLAVSRSVAVLRVGPGPCPGVSSCTVERRSAWLRYSCESPAPRGMPDTPSLASRVPRMMCNIRHETALCCAMPRLVRAPGGGGGGACADLPRGGSHRPPSARPSAVRATRRPLAGVSVIGHGRRPTVGGSRPAKPGTGLLGPHGAVGLKLREGGCSGATACSRGDPNVRPSPTAGIRLYWRIGEGRVP